MNWIPLFSSSLAFGLVTPMFLGAGAIAVGIPILIHILNRRRFKTVNWAAMEFLLRAMRKNRRRLQFEQWLLLATRCLLLLLLGFALARPFFQDTSGIAAMASQRSGLHIFIIDNSYSMAYEADRPDAPTQLDQAKKLAKAAIDRLASGGESVVILTASSAISDPSGNDPRNVIAEPTYNLEEARAAVDRIPQTYGGTDLAWAMQRAIEIGRDDTHPSKHLYLFTDGTRSAWASSQAPAIKAAAAELAKSFRITNFNLARDAQWNQATLEVKPSSRLVNKFAHDFSATVRGFGNGPDAILQWKLDDTTLPGGGTIKLDDNTPPHTQSQADFKVGGPRVVSANLVGQDRLKVDNIRWRAVEFVTDLKVLMVEGERKIGEAGGSAKSLALALAPPKEAGANQTGGKTDSYIAADVISDLELGNKVLNDYRCLILVGVGQIQPAQADQIQKFVEAGGTLILFMGEPVNPDNYNTVLYPRKLMPGPLTKRMSVSMNEKGFTFDFKPLADLHPYLKVFSGEERTGLDTAQVFTYWQVDVAKGANVERVLDYLPKSAADAAPAKPGSDDETSHADPAITTHALGKGRVVFFSTSAGSEWTSLTAKPVYIPLMHEVLAGSVGAGDEWLNRTIGQMVEIPSAIKLTGVPQLVDPNKIPVTMEQVTENGEAIYRSRPLEKPGVYQLSTGAGTYPIAVNVPEDPDMPEADIHPLDNAAIKAAMGDIDVDLQGDVLPSEAELRQEGNDMGWSVMMIVLALVAAECFMAMRFGHYRKK